MYNRSLNRRRGADWASSLGEVRKWQLSREETREARAKLKNFGEGESALALLRHSIACGHRRLIVHRYLIAAALGVEGLEQYTVQFAAAAERLTADELARAVFEAKERSKRYKKGGLDPEGRAAEEQAAYAEEESGSA